MCERGAKLICQLDTLAEGLHTHRGGLVGALRVNAPLGFGRCYVTSVIADFQRQHPDIDIELAPSDASLVEAASRFDVVVHIGTSQVSSLVGRVIASSTRFVYASLMFVKRLDLPEMPNDLAVLPYTVLRENKEGVSLWHFSKDRTGRNMRVPRPLIYNGGDVIRQ